MTAPSLARLLVLCVPLLAACATPVARRPFEAAPGMEGVAYGPHRDGQRPGGPSPSRAELREDLEILRGRFALLRLYGADPVAAEILGLVREERLPFRVVLGAWIAPGAAEENRAQVEEAVRLARAFPDVVVAICVGNETQVSWSDHRVPEEELVAAMRRAREGARVPVATADDFSYWLDPRSREVAREADLLLVHVHPMWNGQPLDGALDFTRERFAAVAAVHPGAPLVLGEVGWATQRLDTGEQGRLMRGVAGEEEQRTFLEQVAAWAARERVRVVWFEAFDERWKGGPEPGEVEKHWGLFDAARRPKAAAAAVPPRQPMP